MASTAICFLSGSKMNNVTNRANAATNTALFHIGNSPSRTPEKMKPGNVARRLSGWVESVCDATSEVAAGVLVPSGGAISGELGKSISGVAIGASSDELSD